MKRISSLWKHPYIGRVGIFLIAIALILGTVTCAPALTKPTLYCLTMTVNPSGGGRTFPSATGTGGPYCCPGGWPVFISATPIGWYLFASWTAVPLLTFGNANASETTFVMPANNVTVTAHFVPLDHFKCYTVLNSSSVEKVVGLKDQINNWGNITVTEAEFFCNPAQKLYNNVTTNITNPNHHLTVYDITTGYENVTRWSMWQVLVTNQFGTQNLNVTGPPVALAVPTWKLNPGNHSAPVGLDHFLLYKVIGSSIMNVGVGLSDEFGGGGQTYKMYAALYFATPVQKTYDGNVVNITAPEALLVFYEIEAGSFQGVVQVNNQFGNQTLYMGNATLLAVPSKQVYT